jgi:AcrR family transcriptional regulator
MRTKTARGTGQAAKKPAAKRKNLRAADRERVILEAAIRFFAEHGFEGQTRELAKRIGITHSAIYRHFPSKEALIERVYEHVYLSRWQDHWAALIKDRSRPLEARLTQFYREYAERIFDYDWVRIFVFSGLKSFDITKRYLTIVSDKIIVPAAIEARKELELPSPARAPITEREAELFWGLHGRIFYIAIRKFVYATPVPDDLDDVIADAVREFMAGAPHVLRRIVTAK